MMDFIKKIKWHLILLAVGIGIGYFIHRCPQQEIHKEDTSRTVDNTAVKSDTKSATGASTTTVKDFVQNCKTGKREVVRETVIRQDPSTSETKSATREAKTEDTRLKLDIVPAQTNYSLALGAKVLPEVLPAIGGAMRLGSTPLWLQGQVVPKFSDPLKSDVVVMLRVDFR